MLILSQAPILVFDDADLISAVNGVAFASFVASGQTCISGTRLIVQDKIYDDFLDMFLRKVEGIHRGIGDRRSNFPQNFDVTMKIYGPALNPKSTMGTIISLRHLERIESMINNRQSGSLLAGGSRMMAHSALDGFDLSQGSFFPPTVVENVCTTDELWSEEVFGPVVVMKRFTVSQKASRKAHVYPRTDRK